MAIFLSFFEYANKYISTKEDILIADALKFPEESKFLFQQWPPHLV